MEEESIDYSWDITTQIRVKQAKAELEKFKLMYEKTYLASIHLPKLEQILEELETLIEN